MTQEEFRDWYYATIVGRPWDGRHNTKPRRGDQTGQQIFFDWWRNNMGLDAPFTNLDMLMYDNKIPIALAEVKIGNEGYGNANITALKNHAQQAKRPLWEFRTDLAISNIVPTKLWTP